MKFISPNIIMNNNIKKYIDTALSNRDITRMLGGKCNIVLYPDLHKYSDIDQLLYPYDACVILYCNKRNYGHWCCVFKIDDDDIEFFDPYGMFPDDEIKFIPAHFRNISNQNYTHLTALLLDSPYQVHYNNYKLQKYKNDVKTCGRHCVVRILNKHLTIDEYVQLFNGKDPDQIVTIYTMNL